jgi:hypothetical protein
MPKELSECNAMAILNYFRQILEALNYFVQSDWRTMVQNLELPYDVQLKAQVVTAIYHKLCHS